MTRQDYIARLEEIRKQVKKIGQAFAVVDLTNATNMESDRNKKTNKLVTDLCDRMYEDIAISAKVAADKAEAGQCEQDDLFAAANRNEKARGAEKPTAAEAEVVDVPMIEHKPLALTDQEPTEKNGCKGKEPGKKGGAK